MAFVINATVTRHLFYSLIMLPVSQAKQARPDFPGPDDVRTGRQSPNIHDHTVEETNPLTGGSL